MLLRDLVALSTGASRGLGYEIAAAFARRGARLVLTARGADALERAARMLVGAARRRGGRVVAVGTTVVRALETAADEAGRVIASQGWTDLAITPERGVRAVDGLLTGFHEPRASHLAMLEAFAGRAHLERAYRAALDAGYLWHEFGDLHLVL